MCIYIYRERDIYIYIYIYIHREREVYTLARSLVTHRDDPMK